MASTVWFMRLATRPEIPPDEMCRCGTVTTAVETPPPTSVDDAQLIAALAAHWDLAVHRIQYAPKGAGSYHWLVEADGRPTHFITVDDLDTKPWIATGRDAACE